MVGYRRQASLRDHTRKDEVVGDCRGASRRANGKREVDEFTISPSQAPGSTTRRECWPRLHVLFHWIDGRTLYARQGGSRRLSSRTCVYKSSLPPYRRCFSASWCMHAIFIMASQMERKNSIASTTSSASTTSTSTLGDCGPLGQTGEVREAAELLSGLSEASCPAGGDWFPACQKSVDSNNSERTDDFYPSLKPAYREVPDKDTTSDCSCEHQENRPPLCDVSNVPYTFTLSILGQVLEYKGAISSQHPDGAEGHSVFRTETGIIEFHWDVILNKEAGRQSTLMSPQASRPGCQGKSARRFERRRIGRLTSQEPGRKTGKSQDLSETHDIYQLLPF
jgi:hypothetical protein